MTNLVVAKPRRITWRPGFSTTQPLATPPAQRSVRTNDTYNQGDGIDHACRLQAPNSVLVICRTLCCGSNHEDLEGRSNCLGSANRARRGSGHPTKVWRTLYCPSDPHPSSRTTHDLEGECYAGRVVALKVAVPMLSGTRTGWSRTDDALYG